MKKELLQLYELALQQHIDDLYAQKVMDEALAAIEAKKEAQRQKEQEEEAEVRRKFEEEMRKIEEESRLAAEEEIKKQQEEEQRQLMASQETFRKMKELAALQLQQLEDEKRAYDDGIKV